MGGEGTTTAAAGGSMLVTSVDSLRVEVVARVSVSSSSSGSEWNEEKEDTGGSDFYRLAMACGRSWSSSLWQYMEARRFFFSAGMRRVAARRRIE